MLGLDYNAANDRAKAIISSVGRLTFQWFLHLVFALVKFNKHKEQHSPDQVVMLLYFCCTTSSTPPTAFLLSFTICSFVYYEENYNAHRKK